VQAVDRQTDRDAPRGRFVCGLQDFRAVAQRNRKKCGQMPALQPRKPLPLPMLLIWRFPLLL
jgi:hypothetical protein